MTNIDLSFAVEAKSDQINAVDLLAGPEIVTITSVESKPNDEQKVWIRTDEHPNKWWKPAKTVIRILGRAWGLDGSQWVGKRAEIYCDPTVKWAGQEVGGIRVSRVSGIDKTLSFAVYESRSKTANVTLEPLPDQQQQQAPDVDSLIARAGDDPEKLKQLFEWAKNQGAPQDVLNKIQEAGRISNG